MSGRDVFLVQSTVFPANDHFMETLFWIDTFKRASAASVTVIVPYFSYAKGDKKDEPRVSIPARVCADALEGDGADRIVAPGKIAAWNVCLESVDTSCGPPTRRP